jgi:histone acetyltransferase 1
LTISLLSPAPSGLEPIATFHPKFTYPIFGDDETIFGYKDLKVNLRYRATDMRPHLDIKYSRKFKAIGATEPTDIKAILQEKEHLPRSTISS